MTDKYKITKINEFEEVAELSPEYLEEKNIKLYETRLKNSGIPQKYWNLELDMYQGELSKDSLFKVKQYIDRCDEEKFIHLNLFLNGSNGTQKTLCSTNIGKGFLKKGHRVKFIYAGELINLLIKNQGYSTNQEIDDYLKEILLCDLLIVDDFADKEKSIYWEKSPDLIRTAWDNFLRRVISENIRIVMTSNKSFDSIQDMLGASLFALMRRNFVELQFLDSISDHVRKLKYEDIWD